MQHKSWCGITGLFAAQGCSYTGRKTVHDPHVRQSPGKD